MDQTLLHFHGPFSFSKSERSLFHSEFAQDEGIYLWVINDEENRINYIHYVGETTNFAKRQREHFTHILGLDYSVIDPQKAKQGIHQVIWKGMWRDKSEDAVGDTLEYYENVCEHLIKYIEIIDIYFAKTNFPTNIRKHVEGCIGKDLRKKYPELTKFYPADNHLGTMKKMLGKIIKITADQPIAGLDAQIEI